MTLLEHTKVIIFESILWLKTVKLGGNFFWNNVLTETFEPGQRKTKSATKYEFKKILLCNLPIVFTYFFELNSTLMLYIYNKNLHRLL